MKTHFLLSLKCFLLIALISGCSGLPTKRDVMPDNTFVSNNPNLSIKVSPEFKYVGNPSDKGSSTSVYGRKLRTSFDSYCFVETDKNMVKRSVVIQFHKTETQFVSDFFRRVKNTVAKGITKCGEKNFQYYTKEVYPSMGSHMTRHIADQGYTMGYGLTKIFGRVYGAKGDTLVKIFYYESFGDSRFDHNFLSEFDKRAELSFDIGIDRKGAGKQVEQASKVMEEAGPVERQKYVRTFIEIKEPDQVHEFGELKYEVSPGDILEVKRIKRCRSGRGICWEVRNVKTGELGYVSAERMEKMHHVYKGDSKVSSD